MSVKLLNDQDEIDAVIAKVSALADHIVWAVDIIGVPSALMLALLTRPSSKCGTPQAEWSRR